MGIPENIDALLVKYDITGEALARIAGVTPGAVTGWRKGARPRQEALESICKHFNLVEDDILSDKYGLAAKEHGTFPQVTRTPIEYSVVSSVEVPVYGKVHAGKPMEHDEVSDTRRVPDFVAAIDPDLFILHSEGDCLNKIIAEEDDLAVSPNTKPKNGDIVVACIDGMDYIVRRFFKTDQTLILSPESYNPAHKDIIITADSDHTVELPGVVIWHQARELMI